MTLVYTNITKAQLEPLFAQGFVVNEVKNSYEILRLHNEDQGITLILYDSKKLVVQHKKEQELLAQDILSYLGEPQKQKSSTEKSSTKQFDAAHLDIPQTHIGSDEALKGDTFGGLVVAAFLLKAGDEEKLKELGVQDSKTMTDEKIMHLAANLGVEFADQCIIEDVTVREYNETIEQVPLTALLNEMHGTAAARLKLDDYAGTKHVIDQYPGCSVGDIKLEKAESHSLAVAAASILARAVGLEQFEELSEYAGFRLPLGSTHVKEALARLKAEGKDLKDYAKVHFKNVQEFL